MVVIDRSTGAVFEHMALASSLGLSASTCWAVLERLRTVDICMVRNHLSPITKMFWQILHDTFPQHVIQTAHTTLKCHVILPSGQTTVTLTAHGPRVNYSWLFHVHVQSIILP